MPKQNTCDKHTTQHDDIQETNMNGKYKQNNDHCPFFHSRLYLQYRFFIPGFYE